MKITCKNCGYYFQNNLAFVNKGYGDNLVKTFVGEKQGNLLLNREHFIKNEIDGYYQCPACEEFILEKDLLIE